MSAGGRLCTLQETTIFGSRGSKLDHLTVCHVFLLVCDIFTGHAESVQPIPVARSRHGNDDAPPASHATKSRRNRASGEVPGPNALRFPPPPGPAAATAVPRDGRRASRPDQRPRDAGRQQADHAAEGRDAVQLLRVPHDGQAGVQRAPDGARCQGEGDAAEGEGDDQQAGGHGG